MLAGPVWPPLCSWAGYPHGALEYFVQGYCFWISILLLSAQGLLSLYLPVLTGHCKSSLVEALIPPNVFSEMLAFVVLT